MKSANLIFALLTGLVMMTGCGSKTNPRNDIVGGAGIQDGTLALCNSFTPTNPNARFNGKVQIYTSSSGVLVEDKVRLRITTLDTQFDTSNSYTIRFYRVSVSSNGAANLDQTPLPFYIENANSQVITANSMTSINKQMTANLRSYAPGSGTSSSEFFNATSFQITNVDYRFQVLKAVLSDGSQTIAESNFLIPAFTANPNTYANSHHATLNNLHPFFASRTTNYTDAQWVNLSQSNCFQ